ncbi:MAG TPA: L-glutamate gamma-semialdehyde dehydrogenase [Pirellulales bacterium]|nr:L-glutamate gamma-semialdehyde dehydrogenase [Pirellulales bacterium]
MESPNDTCSSQELARIEATTLEVGRAILDRRRRQRTTIFDRRWWDDRVMAWTMRDEALKVQMFRFVDVLPMLTTSESVTRHLQEYLGGADVELPAVLQVPLSLAMRSRSLASRVLALAARKNAQGYARRFIAGTNVAEVLAAAMRARKQRRAFTLDLLGEAVTSEAEADCYLQAYVDLIRGIAPTVNAWPEVPQIDRGAFGDLPRVNLSVKLSALDSQFDAIDPEGTFERVAARLRVLLRLAREHRAHLHVDMESYKAKALTLEIFQRILLEDEFRDWPDVGIVIQTYLRDAADDLAALADWAERRGTPVWVRLVKGAYWDYETVNARSLGWPVPVFEHKHETDANFERQTRFLLRHAEVLRPAIASHNVRSLAHAIAVARRLGLPRGTLELQMLYGMADDEADALVELDQRVRIYMPFGELLPGMAYLVRRLLENTSNDSFLRASVQEHLPAEQLLMNPLNVGGGQTAHVRDGDGAAKRQAVEQRSPTAHFTNEPPTDFARPEAREAMRQSLATVAGQLGKHASLWIDGRAVDTSERLSSYDPSHKSRLVGTTASANWQQVLDAVAAAKRAQRAWNALGVERRAQFLERAAEAMARRRFELAAWEVYECGKVWREADADVAEAIDFCRFYALAARALQGEGVDLPGEENRFVYLPRGVAAVIAPWNFPLAILTGMTVAALVTGNTVVMKPAEQSPLVASLLMEIFNELDLPGGVLSYLPGTGEVAGAALVEHPDTALIAFTGSRAVGLAINARAADVSAKLPYVKRVIAEMGGKNAIIVDDDADLDEAVLGVVRSAFGYQGQKCSACSRVIVLDSIYDGFVARLVETARALKVGPAEDPATTVGPVIDAESFERVRKYIEIARGEGREVLAVDPGSLAGEGHYIGPHIYADVPPGARIAQQEIFGPVLAVLRAGTFDEALQIANGTNYALTGGVFSRSPAHLEQARNEFLVGNLYLNRGITGALVGRQPFGGFKMSGIGSKAGGADYLLQFVIPRTVTENTLRRGFAPPSAADAAERLEQ